MNNSIKNVKNTNTKTLSKRIIQEKELCRQTKDVLRTLSSSHKALAKELNIQWKALTETQKLFEMDFNYENGDDNVDAGHLEVMKKRDFLYDQMYPIKENNIKIKMRLKCQIPLTERIKCYNDLRRNKQKLILLKELISENDTKLTMDFSRLSLSSDINGDAIVWLRIVGCDQISRSFSLNSIVTGLPCTIKKSIKQLGSLDTGDNINAKVKCNLLIGGKVIFSTVVREPSTQCWNAIFEYNIDRNNPLEIQVVWIAPYQQLSNIIKQKCAHYESLNFVLSGLAYVPLHESLDSGFTNRTVKLYPEGRVFLETNVKLPTVTKSNCHTLPRLVVLPTVKPIQHLSHVANCPLPGYSLIALLGTGHFGKIILCQKLSDKKYYAVKIIKKQRVVESNEYEQIITEKTVLEVIRSHNHPLMVHLLSCIQDSGHIMFVLEFIQAGDLITLINSVETFSAEQALFYIASVVLCFEFLHKNHIMYRDLKMENLLLDAQGYIKLVDFGLCKLKMNKDGLTQTFCGTMDYMAPEIFSGDGYTRMIDWWTLGVLLYYMLVGEVPFQADTESESIEYIRYRSVKIPTTMDTTTSSFIISLLNKNPKSRLGARYGATEVKIHPYFFNIDFDRIFKRKSLAPFIPKLKHDHDLTFFDRQFTTQKPTLSVTEVDLKDNPDAKLFFDEFV